MGKYILLVVAAVMAGSSTLMFQSKTTSLDTDQRQAQRQEKVIARQIARTGYNAVLAKARQHEKMGKKVEQIVNDVGTLTGDYQGGTYTARLKKVSPTSYLAQSIGELRSAAGTVNVDGDSLIQHEIEESHRNNTMPGASIPSTPSMTVSDSSTLDITFIESMAGYCSAIYLQRLIPKTNNGHGNNCDGVDSSNPGNAPHHGDDTDSSVDDECGGGGAAPGNGNGGNGKSKYIATTPELVYAPGNNRDGAEANYSRTIGPNTRLNFILAVDDDYTCEREGEAIDINDGSYSYTRKSFSEDVSKFGKVHEAPYSLMQENPSQPGTWRVAFEDLIFDDEKLWDIKQNGYPSSDNSNQWDNKDKTYGGNGWSYDSNGYADLRDYGSVPDFSDQVIEVKIVPVSGSGGDEPATD